MIEPEILTEVPSNLKRLIRLVVRGFYSLEHAMIIDLLVRNPCMKEDDIVEILRFERKQLRALINTLKTEKFVKTRLKMETDAENKSTRQTYYFINYQVFVNIVKYKLDHIRRKIEMEEMHNTSRASFRCPTCEKTFTDLEVNELFDMMSGTFRCTFCNNEVEEDADASSVQDSRTLLAKFNEQIQPVYDLLQKCDDIKLAPELLEPEPTDLSKIHNRSHTSKSSNMERDVWSGDKNRTTNYNLGSDSTVTISMGAENDGKKQEAAKEVPVWMSQSTVEGGQEDSRSSYVNEDSRPTHMEAANRTAVSNEIETLLIIHEKKGGAPTGPIPGQRNESSSSDSEDETPKYSAPSQNTGTARVSATFCNNEVEEDADASSIQDSRTLRAKFNEQIQPVYDLLQKCDDIKLAPELLEPEPTDLSKIHNRSHTSKSSNMERDVWSGDKNRTTNYNLGSDSTVTISMGAENDGKKQEAAKEVPVWMSQSTVEGGQEDSRSSYVNEDSRPTHMEAANRTAVSNEIETLLIIHEKKGGAPTGPIPGQRNESSSSDSEDETPKYFAPSQNTGTARVSATFCNNEVEEDADASSIQDSRTLLAKFNEQIQPVYDLLQKCDDIKLAPELLEPEPTDLSKIHNRSHTSKSSNMERDVWSGDKNRTTNYNLGSDSTVTISMGAENDGKKQEAAKEVPVWMSQSTVEGGQEDSRSSYVNEDSRPTHMEAANRTAVSNEIETLLIIHEKKGGAPTGPIPGQRNESSSSDSEDETPKYSAPSQNTVEEMESEEEETMVSVAGKVVPLNEVTDEMVSKMSPEEKEEYIRLGQELYQNMYE